MTSRFERPAMRAGCTVRVLVLLLVVPSATAGVVEARTPDIVFSGMCEASAAAAIDAERFVVANDDDNVLRVYSKAGGPPLVGFDLSNFLGVQGSNRPRSGVEAGPGAEREARPRAKKRDGATAKRGRKKGGKKGEKRGEKKGGKSGGKQAGRVDLEAAAEIGPHTFWITSHGRSSSGKIRPERQRLFMTETRIFADRVEIVPVGRPYSTLLDDLAADERTAPFGLESARLLAPKAPGGLDIEGLAATPEGHLLIGFRSPVPGDRALIVPLLNPREALAGVAARFGAPITLDLEGFGIRSMESRAGRYLIIGGPPGRGGGPSRAFEWDGRSAPKRIDGVMFEGWNPEAIAFEGADDSGEYLVLSDDGNRDLDGRPCEELEDPARKRFRGRLVRF